MNKEAKESARGYLKWRKVRVMKIFDVKVCLWFATDALGFQKTNKQDCSSIVSWMPGRACGTGCTRTGVNSKWYR